jgi:hypothetical protein
VLEDAVWPGPALTEPLLVLLPAVMPDWAVPPSALALDMPTPTVPSPMLTPVDWALEVPFWLLPTAAPVMPLLLLFASAVPPPAATEPAVLPLTEPKPSLVDGPDPAAASAPEPWAPLAFAELVLPLDEAAAPLVEPAPTEAEPETLPEPTVPSPAGAPTPAPPEAEAEVPEPVPVLAALLDGPELLLEPAAALEPVPRAPCAPPTPPEAPAPPAPTEPPPEALLELEPAEEFEDAFEPGPPATEPAALPALPLTLPPAFAPEPLAFEPAPLTPEEDEPLSPMPIEPWMPSALTDPLPTLPEEFRPAVLADWPAALECPASEAPLISGAPVSRTMPSAPIAAISTALRAARPCAEARRWRPATRAGLASACECGDLLDLDMGELAFRSAFSAVGRRVVGMVGMDPARLIGSDGISNIEHTNDRNLRPHWHGTPNSRH